MTKNKKNEEYWIGNNANRHKFGFNRRTNPWEQERVNLLKGLYGGYCGAKEAEAMERPPEKIDKPMLEILKKINIADKFIISDLIKEWAKLVGEEIASYARPTAVRGKTLLIEVDRPVFMHNLEMYHKDDIKTLVVNFCKEQIDSIRFVAAGKKPPKKR